MLEELSISNLGIVKDTSLKLEKGLVCITGETGSGKSMLLNSLHLLTGGRAKNGLIRDNETELNIESVWSIDSEVLTKQIDDAGAKVIDGEVIINRSVDTDGKSKSTLNGRRVPAGILSEVGVNLVSIHGQSDQLKLKDETEQLKSLDRFGGTVIASLLKDYKESYAAWTEAKKTLDDVKSNFLSRQREYESLVEFLEDFDKLKPEAGEIERLEAELEPLLHFEDIKFGLNRISALLNPDDFETVNPSTILNEVYDELNKLGKYDHQLEELGNTLSEVLDSLSNFETDISVHANNFDTDKLNEAETIQDRIQDLKAFQNRYRSTIDILVESIDETRSRVEELDPENNDIDFLESEVNEAYAIMEEKAKELTKKRTSEAKKLQNQVNKELTDLAMTGSSFVVQLTDGIYTSKGKDKIGFYLMTIGSDKKRALGSSASGGELSRIMLALELVLADESTPTFVFDEIDSGVGGSTAIEIGKKLALLSKQSQVIVITHLPQVAAFADSHLMVDKTVNNDGVSTTVKTIDSVDRINELARMLSGLEGSGTGFSHSMELLSMAKEFKETSI